MPAEPEQQTENGQKTGVTTPLSFPLQGLPKDLDWGEISITFVDGHTVQIKARSFAQRFNFAELGMIDRKSAGPNEMWKNLQTLAELGGSVTGHEKYGRRIEKKRISLLRKQLKEIFDLSDDPIPYSQEEGYVASFSIHPESPS